MTTTPIADYALLSDGHSAALVSRGASVEWLCLPRFDAPSVFARILDEAAGSWSIAPAEPASVQRRYIKGTLVLETTFVTEGGELTVTDALAIGPRPQPHGLGRRVWHTLVRQVACSGGEVTVDMRCAPRAEYGLVVPTVRRVEDGVLFYGGAELLRLSTAVPLSISDGEVTARMHLREDETRSFALRHRPSDEPWEPSEISQRLSDTVFSWQAWSEQHTIYDGFAADLVNHSGRVLKALTYEPTGAIVAAPTTSLPEAVGGERNWDYRYTWVRDASLTLEALWVAACPHEADTFFTWMARTAAARTRQEQQLQIMYGIGGEHDLSERELPHLSGWRDSRPVRIGNGAWNQVQLDVYGELLSAAAMLAGQLERLDAADKEFLVDVADLAAARWQDTDQGIWEVRGPPRHFLHSKLMCWVALDRALQLAQALGAEHRTAEWKAERDRIRSAILERGWNPEANAFTQSFGGRELDASVLLLPIVGFLPATDPRVRATITAVERELTDERGLVYRYCGPDGLEGDEGTFLLCTFWLAEALALAGEQERAVAVFERVTGYANDLGLLAEEVDPASGEQLGNFPQAFSHIGLINAAWAIERARRPAGLS